MKRLTALRCAAVHYSGRPRTAKRLQLFEWKFDRFFFVTRNQFVSLDDSRARVPAEDRIVVTWWTKRFGSFKPAHCLTQKIIRLKPAARRVLSQFHLRATLRYDSGIICAVIFRIEPRQQFFCLRIADSIAFFETI